MAEIIDLTILDRLDASLRKNRKVTAETGARRIWIPIKDRLHEFDQMIELVSQFKAALAPKPGMSKGLNHVDPNQRTNA